MSLMAKNNLFINYHVKIDFTCREPSYSGYCGYSGYSSIDKIVILTEPYFNLFI